MPIALCILAPLVYLAACALAAGLLAYPLHFVLPDELGYHTLVSRGAEVLLALGLIPLGRRLAVGRAELGWSAPARLALGAWARGFAYGLLMLGAHLAILLLLDVRSINYDKLETARILRLSAKAWLIGLAVASIEEPIFRGFLFGALKQKVSAVNAALISAFYFAALHFLDGDLRPAPEDVRWNTGLAIVADAFAHIARLRPDSFLALFAAGALLASVRLLAPRNGLAYCMGIHAGWVFVIKVAKPFTHRTHDGAWAGLASDFDGVIGYFSAAWTLVLTLALALLLRARRNRS
jgi:membrane protease YdiL (CAAX protease family)